MTIRLVVILMISFFYVLCGGETNDWSFVWEKWFKSVDGGILHHSYIIQATVADGVNKHELADELIKQIGTDGCSGQKIADELRSVSFLKMGLRDNDALALVLARIEGIPFEIYTFEDATQRQAKIVELLATVHRNHKRQRLLSVLSEVGLAVIALLGGLGVFLRMSRKGHGCFSF